MSSPVETESLFGEVVSATESVTWDVGISGSRARVMLESMSLSCPTDNATKSVL